MSRCNISDTRPMKQLRRIEKRKAVLRESSVFLVALLALSTTVAFAAQESRPPAPDVIFIGQFLTLDPGHPHADAIAVSAGRITAVGSKSDVAALAGKATRRVPVPGVVLPGLADAHVHTEGIGEQLERLDLRGLSKAAILAKVAEAAHSAPKGSWVFGGGWDEGFWRPAEFPTAKELDVVSGDHPVRLSRIDEHSIWVNSKVLALAKISTTTPNPDGGLIRRSPAGEPTASWSTMRPNWLTPSRKRRHARIGSATSASRFSSSPGGELPASMTLGRISRLSASTRIYSKEASCPSGSTRWCWAMRQ